VTATDRRGRAPQGAPRRCPDPPGCAHWACHDEPDTELLDALAELPAPRWLADAEDAAHNLTEEDPQAKVDKSTKRQSAKAIGRQIDMATPLLPGPAALGRLSDRADELAAGVADLREALEAGGLDGYGQDLSDAHLVLSAIAVATETLAKASHDGTLRPAFGRMGTFVQLAHLRDDHGHPEVELEQARARVHRDLHGKAAAEPTTPHLHADQEGT
jgi:hypothetical protein